LSSPPSQTQLNSKTATVANTINDLIQRRRSAQSFDARTGLSREAFFTFYEEYIARERRQRSSSGGGDFYNNQNTRVGERFALQVITAAKEGRVSFKEAYDLTGLRGGAFQEYAYRLGVDLP